MQPIADQNNAPSFMAVERPQPSETPSYWGSDAVADVLRSLDIPYIALNPGASYRGLHDSLVNHLGNETPKMLLVLHEEHAVAIAHGWSKVEGRSMAAGLHSNVGLMHATMAIFNAWCDRAPIILVGATGPLAAEKRRHWIEWIHTAQDQGALVRNYVKWDNQPVSSSGAVEALLRAHKISNTAPCGPTYVCLDLGMQETRLESPVAIPKADRFRPGRPSSPPADIVDQSAALLASAKRPLILCGRTTRLIAGWNERVALAEALNAFVVTDLKTAASFPNTHKLHAATPGIFPTAEALELVREADVILSLDWVDLGGTLKAAETGGDLKATIIQVSIDQYVHNGWSMDHQVLPPSDIHILTEVEPTVTALLQRLKEKKIESRGWDGRAPVRGIPKAVEARPPAELTVRDIGVALLQATKGKDVCLARTPTAWPGDAWPIEHPLDFLGLDGGGGLASGPGLTIGAALALKDKQRLAIGIIGDGDFIMGVTAIWTAVHYGVPGMIIVANNGSFFNDEVHQERVADARGRERANKWIGMRIASPDLDLAQLARGQGAIGIGPIRDEHELAAALSEAIDAVSAGHFVVLDVRVRAGYEPAMTSGLAARPK